MASWAVVKVYRIEGIRFITRAQGLAGHFALKFEHQRHLRILVLGP